MHATDFSDALYEKYSKYIYSNLRRHSVIMVQSLCTVTHSVFLPRTSCSENLQSVIWLKNYYVENSCHCNVHKACTIDFFTLFHTERN